MNIDKVETIKKLPDRKRVCAYARVSAEKEMSLHSLSYQVSYYSQLIQSHRDWKYVGVYSDEGISGTKEARPGFQKMMEGAGAQATLFGTNIQAMGDKFSSMAQKDTLMSRSLAETGITMGELATAMGMTGATADEVKAKWKELDTNQRAAILGTAASIQA